MPAFAYLWKEVDMRIKRRVLMEKLEIQAFTFAGIILLASLGATAGQPAGVRAFNAELSGDEEVPSVKTEAAGTATFQIGEGGNIMTYTLTISRIKDITGAFLCEGKKGENGAIVYDLFREPRKEDISGTLLAEGKIEPYLLFGPLQGGSVQSLMELMETGQIYVNLLTKRHPDGEIRGQVR
jgi:hypothetical protein